MADFADFLTIVLLVLAAVLIVGLFLGRMAAAKDGKPLGKWVFFGLIAAGLFDLAAFIFLAEAGAHEATTGIVALGACLVVSLFLGYYFGKKDLVAKYTSYIKGLILGGLLLNLLVGLWHQGYI